MMGEAFTPSHHPTVLAVLAVLRSTRGGQWIISIWDFTRTGDGRTHTTARTSTRITFQSCIHPGTGIHTIGTVDTTPGVIRTGTIGTGTITTLLQQTLLIPAETIGAMLWRRPAGRAG